MGSSVIGNDQYKEEEQVSLQNSFKLRMYSPTSDYQSVFQFY